jgi:hypothetical protein
VPIFEANARQEKDDGCEGNGFEDRDVMNDRTKSETASRPAVHPSSEKKAGDPQQPDGWDDKFPNGKQRTRLSEPYLTWLGQSLRQSYEETLNEPVPDSFRSLLNRLEQEDEDKSA